MTFASPSSVRHLVALLGSESVGLNRIPVVCAGPITAQAARGAGLLVTAVSESPEPAAMVQAIVGHWLKAGGETPLDEAAETVHAGRSAR
jgi:uroporphyrinogen-III synthase